MQRYLIQLEHNPLERLSFCPISLPWPQCASAHLPLSTEFTPAATHTEIFDNLQSSLIFLGQMCDDNCTVILNKEKLFAIKKW